MYSRLVATYQKSRSRATLLVLISCLVCPVEVTDIEIVSSFAGGIWEIIDKVAKTN